MLMKRNNLKRRSGMSSILWTRLKKGRPIIFRFLSQWSWINLTEPWRESTIHLFLIIRSILWSWTLKSSTTTISSEGNWKESLKKIQLQNSSVKRTIMILRLPLWEMEIWSLINRESLIDRCSSIQSITHLPFKEEGRRVWLMLGLIELFNKRSTKVKRIKKRKRWKRAVGVTKIYQSRV